MRLIDSDALGVGRCSKDVLPASYCAGWNGLIGLIEKAPTIDAVPVVRCRECKQGEIDDQDFSDQYYCHAGCGWNKGDFYCAYGERKEGADNA